MTKLIATSAPTIERDPDTQRAFEAAVQTLWARDAWTDPWGAKRLNADLVLEGGGVKGIGLAGAILVLAEAGYHFPRVAGTSAGAIAGTLVASLEKAGRGMTELKRYLGEVQFTKFVEEGPLRHLADKLHLAGAADAVTLIEHLGLYSGNYLAEWLGPILDELGVKTFGDLRITMDQDPGMSLPAERQYRLVVHASDITRSELVHLPWDYNYYGLVRDEEAVLRAVRASMSIPFFFVPVTVMTNPARVEVPSPGGGSVTETWEGGSVTWVDGGMLANFPIDAFDRLDGKPARWPTIGIKLSAQQLEIVGTAAARTTAAEAFCCLHTMLNEWDRYHVDQTAADRTIFVDNLVVKPGGAGDKVAVSATDFHLSPEQQDQLFVNGAKAATAFIIAKASAGIPRN